MAPHYEVFYSLETTIRTLIAETLEAAEGSDWWTQSAYPASDQAGRGGKAAERS